MHVNVFDFSELLAKSTERYLEFVRVSSFSVGIYVLDGGATDPQKPHSEDEVYYVASGRAKMMINSDGDTQSFDVCPGTIIFVPGSGTSFVLQHHRAACHSRILRPSGGFGSPGCLEVTFDLPTQNLSEHRLLSHDRATNLKRHPGSPIAVRGRLIFLGQDHGEMGNGVHQPSERRIGVCNTWRPVEVTLSMRTPSSSTESKARIAQEEHGKPAGL
jgi:hypothetical protein